MTLTCYERFVDNPQEATALMGQLVVRLSPLGRRVLKRLLKGPPFNLVLGVPPTSGFTREKEANDSRSVKCFLW